MTDNILTPELRKLFEARGVDLLKADLSSSGIAYLASSQAKQAAQSWIKEQEEKQGLLEQKRHADNFNATQQSVIFAKRAYWIAIASLIVSMITLLK